MKALRGLIWIIFKPILWGGYLAFMAYASWFIGWHDAKKAIMRNRSNDEQP